MKYIFSLLILLSFSNTFGQGITMDSITVLKAHFNSNQISTQEFIDVNLFPDINPEKHILAANTINLLATINLFKYSINNYQKVSVELEGDISTMTQNFYFKDSSLLFMDMNRIDYSTFKWDDKFDSTKFERIHIEGIFEKDKIIWDNTPDKNDSIKDNHLKTILHDAYLLLHYK